MYIISLYHVRKYWLYYANLICVCSLKEFSSVECLYFFFQIVSKVSSLGLNEQELTFLSHAAIGPHSEYFDTIQGQPEIHKISDIILWVLRTYGHSKENPSYKLTRVHFHCLTYHIIGIYPSAWSNNPSAVGAGTRVAGIQACDVESPDPDLVTLKFPEKFKLFSGDKERSLNESKPIITWKKEGFHFALSPVLVCKQPLKTVGLGDSISATGLMFSEFVSNFNSWCSDCVDTTKNWVM